MKDFFNADEREQHLKIMACQTSVDEFKDSNALTEEEKKCLRNAHKWLVKFTDSVFTRFGAPYGRKLQNTLSCNTLKFVGKYAQAQSAISECAQEDLLPKIRELQRFNCLFCEREDHIDCAMYAMGVSVGLEDKNETGCPFKL